MSEKETTSTTRIFKSCLDIVKGFSKQNNISDSQQISIIVETYKHLAPANTRMDGFIYDHFIKEDQEEKRFTYETLYNLYKYAINKNSNLKDLESYLVKRKYSSSTDLLLDHKLFF